MRAARPDIGPGRRSCKTMLYITGDTHGSYKRLRKFFRGRSVQADDLLVILGDAGLTYYGDERDEPHKNSAARLPVPLLCLRGNHDRRPETVPGLKPESRFGGTVYADEAYPGILFAVDGEIYRIQGYSVLAVGGAYSIDKEWRLAHGYNWFDDEQLTIGEMNAVEAKLAMAGWRVDVTLTHTCPLRYEPREAFFSGIDQAAVDKSMETWLDSLERRLTYRAWYCGHYHVDKQAGPVRFLYRDVITLANAEADDAAAFQDAVPPG